MLYLLSDAWWTLALRGIIALLFGVLAFTMSDMAMPALFMIFGVYAFIDGAFVLVAAGGRDERDDWSLLLLQGVLGVSVGILAFLHPMYSTLGALLYIAAFSLALGVMQLHAALRLRRELGSEWRFALAGIASIVFAIALVGHPRADAMTVMYLVGAWAIVWGSLLIAAGARLRRYAPVSPEEAL